MQNKNEPKMKVAEKYFRTIWPDARCMFVEIIDQTKLPFAFETVRIDSVQQMAHAIRTMQVRGAPLIGAAAAYGMALAMLEDDSDTNLLLAAEKLINSRPTAVNLKWAVSRMVIGLQGMSNNMRKMAAWIEAAKIAEEDVVQNKEIGQHGLALIRALATARAGEGACATKTPSPSQGEGWGGGENKFGGKYGGEDVIFNILTHCNAGWLATVDFGTALAPIYAAHDAGLNIHVWVSETRPRNQGASLTAWELAQHGVPHTVITDNAGGHLMQQGLVDMVIVGADRVTANGDVCNKIGTYLKALAAFDNNIPFYAAVPSPTIDWQMSDYKQIEIEERNSDEVTYIQGLGADGSLQTVRVIPHESNAANPAFDVTPARLVTGIITEKGVFAPKSLPK
jgi:methylthioribose-1-phosphate isomerase